MGHEKSDVVEDGHGWLMHDLDRMWPPCLVRQPECEIVEPGSHVQLGRIPRWFGNGVGIF
eukprot:2921448-Pleurochrysis_carterae.AAC.1